MKMYRIEYNNPVVQVPACIIKEREVEMLGGPNFNIIYSNGEVYKHWGTLQDNLIFPTEQMAMAYLLTLKKAELKRIQDAGLLVEKQIEDLNSNLNSILPK